MFSTKYISVGFPVELHKAMSQKARDEKLKIPEYLRELVRKDLGLEIDITSPEWAVAEARRKRSSGEIDEKNFTLPDIYGTLWESDSVPVRLHGVMGRRFYSYITDNEEVDDIEVNKASPSRATTYRFK